jgi:opacity protein-like surface antigen
LTDSEVALSDVRLLIDTKRTSLLLGRLVMRRLLGSVLLIAAVTLSPAASVAQHRAAGSSSFGAELNWSSDVDFGVGARAVFSLQSVVPKTPLDAIVSFDYFFPSAPASGSAHYWELNGNVAYRFRVPARSSFAPYAGGGLNIAHASASATGGGTTVSASDTKAGLNLMGGATFKMKSGKLTPFAEARGELGGGKTFILTGGVRF